MRSPKINSKRKRDQIFHKPDSATSKLLEIIEFLIGLNYIAFSRKSLGAKLMMDPYWEGQKILNAFSNLERGKFVKKVGNHSYKLTKKGIKRINFSKFFKLKLDKKKKDGFWRVVIFDIAEGEKAKRELLRQKLKEFDFQMIQRSAFASPYICEKEITQLCEILNLRNEVYLIKTKNLESFEKKLTI